MKYAVLGRTGLKVLRLGFGCMRLPSRAPGKVDPDRAIPLLRRAVELGVTYFDTAVGYADSQNILGEALVGLRAGVVISTKNPNYARGTPGLFWKNLEDSLRLLRTDQIDVYHFHSLTWESYVKDLTGPDGALAAMRKARDQGLVRHIACSIHDTPEHTLQLLETGDFESVTIQYNLMSRKLEKVIARAQELNLGVVIMGPVGGGRLGMESGRMRELTHGVAASTAEAALRFVLANPGVTLALSGMSSREMLEENVRTVSLQEPLTPVQVRYLDDEIRRIQSKVQVPCPACGYCRPCPYEVDIPANIAVFNDYCLYEDLNHARSSYAVLNRPAAACTACGACRPKCPQKIDIPAVLKKLVERIDPAYGSLRPDWAVLAADARRLQARLVVRNLNRNPVPVQVAIRLENGGVPQPGRLDLGAVNSFGSAESRIEILLSPDNPGGVAGVCALSGGKAEQTEPFFLPILFIPRGRPYTHRARLTPADFAGDAALARAHGYTLALSRDAERIAMELDIRSTLQALAPPGVTTGGRIEMYLDLRPANTPDPGRYTEGVDKLYLSLAEAAYRSKSGKPYTLNLRYARTSEGCRINLDLPFREFMRPEWPPPETIGLDVLFVACAADGTVLCAQTYGRRAGLFQDPRRFTRAWLI